MKLIPITERLPEIDQDVIVWNCKKLVAAKYVMRNMLISKEPYVAEMQGQFETEKYPSEMDRAITTYWIGVTHWMPAIIENPNANS